MIDNVHELPARQHTVDEIRADIDRERRDADLRALEPLEKRAQARAEELRARGVRWRQRDPAIIEPVRRMLAFCRRC